MGIKRSVSLYSLQDEYVRKKMDLEDMFKELEDLGADLELLSDEMLHNSPFPRQETLDKWDELVSKYNVKPVCNDIFINSTLYRNRRLSVWEETDLLIHEIKLAKRLGFPMIRLVSDTTPEIIEIALPYAEKYNVVLAIEVHAAMSFNTPVTKEFIKIMKRTNSKFLELVVDLGIFCKRHPRVSKEFFMELGVSQGVADYVDSIFEKGLDPLQVYGPGYFTGSPAGPQYPAELVQLLNSHIDREYCMFACGYENTPLNVLDEFLPYMSHIHGKIWEMTEQGEYSIDYDAIVKYLSEHNWSGYISTEYEGSRFALKNQEVNGLAQVHIHQKYLKELIEKYNKEIGEKHV